MAVHASTGDEAGGDRHSDGGRQFPAFLACMTLTRTDGAHKLVLRDLHINKTCLGRVFRIELRPVSSRDSQRFFNALVQAYVQRSWFPR